MSAVVARSGVSIDKVGWPHRLAFVLMVGAMLAATLLIPRTYYFEELGRPAYDTLMPSRFGDWVDIRTAESQVVSPVEREALGDIYSQVVSRTYLHRPSGRKIMLSLAYVDHIKGTRQVHRPESCYSSQGFVIRQLSSASLHTKYSILNVFRMSADVGERHERVIYWIRIGDQTIGGPPYQVNLARMKMAAHEVVADGLLFRTSEIFSSESDSNEFQEKFIRDLLQSVAPGTRKALIGRSVSS